jgi:CspA family cold shock protein
MPYKLGFKLLAILSSYIRTKSYDCILKLNYLHIGVLKMEQGTVKWFDDSKGFGFIQKENGEDIFVHHTSIQSDGFRTLAEGARVSFEIEDSPKGPRAVAVTTL